MTNIPTAMIHLPCDGALYVHDHTLTIIRDPDDYLPSVNIFSPTSAIITDVNVITAHALLRSKHTWTFSNNITMMVYSKMVENIGENRTHGMITHNDEVAYLK